ncbi:hypothetical protein [Deinococcus radiodurans]|jgi:hypothetical protein|uniref:Uncharacterized protein n=1 Tax=Deinococcus radiodurans (strain ATCC 13939 / DSM 20539 / JCM 16871 / CCUG 27074 / LMG 4051 / NBRC 15346 / NCIMB 9279 / VKM B-1422 / R1) TaxID=243230 RepID=Q9RZ75_DEIRA|nr:hypothetical protein [Deinococcus radiodurans]AAF12349.1 hypothetical protein DR_A0079 [Deinococcus radiodurans R1 = ATCC 13939 = DSM 20539]ANC72939.1 hypothetical protein A2G07_13885 [Deinococcus radiodurans R1 = ATCC 13939 = DSM 20539]QEM72897.1 hypothetical protein DXG80_13855 [Deinococcus radiodurans]QIP30424.1 hypothetical protein HAV23_14320 [Deinococcus radiodurans]QIP33217.1 hypothetical protein HAV35_13670 [Deinococcus radiodurans]
MTKPTNDQLRQLLDLPDQILAVEKTINGLKSDKAKVTRELDALEARHRLRISKEGGYTNADDRKAALIVACEDDELYSAKTERLDKLNGMIRSKETERDHLRRTRAAIQAGAYAYIVAKTEELMKDRDLITAIGSRLLA